MKLKFIADGFHSPRLKKLHRIGEATRIKFFTDVDTGSRFFASFTVGYRPDGSAVGGVHHEYASMEEAIAETGAYDVIYDPAYKA